MGFRLRVLLGTYILYFSKTKKPSIFKNVVCFICVGYPLVGGCVTAGCRFYHQVFRKVWGRYGHVLQGQGCMDHGGKHWHWGSLSCRSLKAWGYRCVDSKE